MSNVLDTKNGFSKADSNNLPFIDEAMVTEFIHQNSRYNKVEMAGWKLSARCSRSSYGEQAIHYVQLRRTVDHKCIVVCHITPEQSNHKRPYKVIAIIDIKSDTILSTSCSACSASKGGCKHAMTLLYWLHRRSSEPSPTETKCYWKKSQLALVGRQIKHRLASDICRKATENRKRSKSEFVTGPDGDFLAQVKQQLRGPSILLHYINDDQPFENLDIHKLACSFMESEKEDRSFNKFMSHCSNKMVLAGEFDCRSLETRTRIQSLEPLWFTMRYGRITASKLYEVANCKTLDGSLFERLMGARNRHLSTPAMRRGIALEPEVLKVVSSLKKMKFQSSGLFLSPCYPIFGASPDGISDHYVIEIKCPSSHETMKAYLRENGSLGPKCLAQIQLQMLLTGRTKGLFCVAMPDFEKTQKVKIIEVFYDAVFVDDLLNRATSFWKAAIFPKLLS